jgi:hypothetical protein
MTVFDPPGPPGRELAHAEACICKIASCRGCEDACRIGVHHR